MTNLYEADYEIIFKGKARVFADDINTANDQICLMDETVEMIDRQLYLTTVKNIRKVKGALSCSELGLNDDN
jgi:hypothetical protein